MGNKLTVAGNFTRPVTILEPARGTNTHNEEVITWVPGVTMLASVRPAPGTERFQSAELAATAQTRFVFRYRRGVLTVEKMLRFDGHDYAISSVTEIGIREGIEVLATARAE